MSRRLRPAHHALIIAMMLAASVGSSQVVDGHAVVAKPVAQTQIPVVAVPFVGCKADGQTGPASAPKSGTQTVALPADVAQRLAFYKAEYGPGVLAPRGWNCFETFGSNGNSLYVTPDPIDTRVVFSPGWRGFASPAIQLSISVGDTSGRFEVAKIIARVFPAHRQFARKVIAENLEPASAFPFGAFPQDKLTYKGNELVEYETSAQTDGLGTRSRLRKNDDPIRGVEILTGSELSLVSLHVRLPANMTDLASPIVHQVERDTAATK